MYRRGLIAVLLAGAVVFATAGCNKKASDQPAPHAVDSAVMEHCRSDANTAPEKKQQLAFLRERDVTITGGNWLDHKVFTTDGYTAYVRYYAGDDQPARRCLFGLEEPADQATSIIEYSQNGKVFEPPDSKVCLSAKPPTITPQITQVQLQCDHLLPR